METSWARALMASSVLRLSLPSLNPAEDILDIEDMLAVGAGPAKYLSMLVRLKTPDKKLNLVAQTENIRDDSNIKKKFLET